MRDRGTRRRNIRASLATAVTVTLFLAASFSRAQEVVVMSSIDEIVDWLMAERWWGEAARGEQLDVPHAMITGINARWQEAAQQLPVEHKKEIFYRLLLPLVVHANEMVMERRRELAALREQASAGRPLGDADLAALRQVAVLLRVADEAGAAALGDSSAGIVDAIDEMLYKLDVIPAGLVLGQGAYESGYGTSRFAVDGNALFGQWTYGGDGLVPEQQRKDLGDHRIAAYDWPFDSVRGYFINLSAHPAYEDFRRLRAELKAAGEPLSSLRLADGLARYSERGQEYVDTLKGIIRVNGLDIADGATFRDEPMRFIVGAEDAGDAARLRDEIERLRDTGELDEIIARMRLE